MNTQTLLGSLLLSANCLTTLAAVTTDETAANDTISSKNRHLNEVVISVHRNDALRRTTPGLMEITTEQRFKEIGANDLLQGLSFQPGLRTEYDCSNCGFTQVRINGMDGHYSQILIDSRPIFSSLNGMYGLDQIPTAMIERVEVVRGGGTALSNPSAIGGTINVITKEPLSNSAEFGHEFLSVGTDAHSFDNTTHLNAQVTTLNHRAGASIYAQNRKRDGYDANGDGYTEMTRLSTQTAGLRAYYKPTNYSKLTLTYQGIHDFRRGGNSLNLPPFEANIAEQTEHTIHGGEMSYKLSSENSRWDVDVYTSFMATTRDSYFGGMGDGSEESKAAALKAYGKTHGTLWASGADFTYKFARLWFMPSTLKSGLLYTNDRLTDKALSYGVTTRQNVNDYAAYVQNEWQCNHFSFLVGARLDKHSLIHRPMVSPRLNLRFTPLPDWDLRLSYARGFRAPQIYNEDLHVSMVGGERLKVSSATNLREERSHSVSLSSDWYRHFGEAQLNLMGEVFLTTLNGAFGLQRTNRTDAAGYTLMERYNGSNAKVYGLNVEAMYATHLLKVQAGITWQQSRWDQAQIWDEDAPAEKQMLRTPHVYGYFTGTIEPIHAFKLSVSGNLTGPMQVGHSAGSGTPEPYVYTTPTFFELGAKAAYEFHLHHFLAEVYLGVKNLLNSYQKDFDSGYNRDSNYIYGPALPRCYYAGITMSL